MVKNIAFIGLGHMGGYMAANLVKAGHQVTGFDLSAPALEAAIKAGANIAESGAQAVTDADVVITMLPAGRHVIGAFEGPDGLLAAAAKGTLFLECSTIAVDDAHTVHQMLSAAGHRGVDAPVSGGTTGAENGTLTFMVGGSDADFADAEIIFKDMGKRIVHCGGPGAGQAAKVCNNMILGVSMIAVSEAFVLGESLGLSNEALFDVASAATGQCWALTTNCPVPGPVPTSPANKNFEPGFAGALMAKDLGLAVQAVDAAGVQARLGVAAEKIYRDFAAGEGERKDFSGIINEIRAASAAAKPAN